jgi:hypothetical protein
LLNNLKSFDKKDYLLRHGFVNYLILHPFNFYDEELVDIYISFVKSIAISITSKKTLKYFLND